MTAPAAIANEPNGRPPEPAYLPFTSRQILVIAGLTLLAIGLRLYKLGEWSFWVDEAHTFRDVMANRETFWASNVAHYPLAYVFVRKLLHAGILEATGEGWLRLPFAFFGALTVPATAVFGRNLVGRRAAMLAALMLAVFPWHLYWSQNARGYAMTSLFTLLAGFAFWQASLHRSMFLGFGAAAAAILGGLAHPSGFLMFAGIGAYAALGLYRDPSLRRALLRVPVAVPLVVATALAVHWLLPAFRTAMEKKPDASVVHLLQTLAWFIGPAFGVAALGGLLLLHRHGWSRAGAFLGCWAFVPIAVLALLGATLTKVTAQYAFFVLPAFLLLASRLLVGVVDAASDGSRIWRLARWLIPAMLVAELLAYDVLYFTEQHGDRPRWREAALWVDAHDTDAKIIVTTNRPSLDYYLRREVYWGAVDAEPEVVSLEPWDIEAAGGGSEYLAALRAEAGARDASLWVIATAPELGEKDRQGTFERALREAGHALRRYPAWTGPKDMTVFVWRVPPLPGR